MTENLQQKIESIIARNPQADDRERRCGLSKIKKSPFLFSNQH